MDEDALLALQPDDQEPAEKPITAVNPKTGQRLILKDGAWRAMAGEARKVLKPLPAWAEKPYTDQVGIYSALKNAQSGFRDDYGGNTVTGDLENTIQSRFSGFGTEGQRDWWAQFRAADNVIRNKLFGASLTASEQKAYRATTVEPSMDPAEIRRNLDTRAEIVRKALSRRTDFLRKQGYYPDAIDAIAGEYAPDLNPELKTSDNQEGGGPTSGMAGAADGSGVPPSGPTRPDGTLMFNDEAPDQRSDAKELTEAQKAAVVSVARTGDKQALIDLYKSWGLSFSTENEAKLDQVIANIQKNPDAPIGVGEVDNSIKPVDTGDGAAGAAARGAGNALTLGFLDEAGALVDTVAKGGTYGDNLDARRGQEVFDEQNSGGARFAGQLLGSLPLGGVEFAGARGAARAAGVAAVRAGETPAAARVIANRVFAQRTAAEAAGIGGVYGFGDAEGSLGDRLGGAAVGAGTGAVGGYALARGGGRFARAMAARRGAAVRAAPTEAQLFGEAAERRGVTYLPADVPDANATRMASGVANMTLGGIPLGEAATNAIGSAARAKGAVADAIGIAGDSTQAGQAIQRGANAKIASTAAKADSLYSAIPIAPDAVADVSATRSTLSSLTAGLQSNPELSAIVVDPKLKAVAGALENEGLSWQDLKAFRTYIGEKLGGPQLQSDTSRTALKALYGALSADMEATATAQGPRALNAFKRANSYYRARETRIENVLSGVLGNDLQRSPDAAFRAVETMATKRSGDPVKFARLIRSLPGDEANTVRATVLDRLGLASAGRQDASQEVYSPAEFMTQWSKLSDRAKSVLFGGEHKQAVDDLVRIADGMKGSQKFANTSKTSLGTNAVATLATLWANPLLGILSVGGQFSAGKALASPGLARWLARAPKKPNLAAQRSHIARLSAIARAEPAIANDVLALQQRLADAFGQAPARLAADEGGERRAPVQRQASDGETANQRLQP